MHPVYPRRPVAPPRRVVTRGISAQQVVDIANITAKYFALGVGIYSTLNWKMYRDIRKKNEKK